MTLEDLRFWVSQRWRNLLLGMGLAVTTLAVLFFGGKVVTTVVKRTPGQADVFLPTIINGELVLPKLSTGPADFLGGKARLGIISANLIGIQDPSAGSGQASKLSAIRILGEVANAGEQVVDGISPVIRFMDTDGKTIGQKIGRLSTGWEFFGIAPGEQTVYDVTVDNPPQADKLEIVLNASSATDSALFDQLKIASRSMEVKTATYQGDASESGGEKVEYYSVAGSVVNILSDPVSDITIYSWARDKEGKVFAFNRQDFKNDLLAAGEKIDFRILLLPLKIGREYDSYEVAAWGKRYRLNL